MRVLLALALFTACNCCGQTFGSWRVNPERSLPADSQAPSLTFHFEQHSRGEVFTVDKTLADGRTTSFSTILYFDSVAREFEDFGCSGTQSSRRIDRLTVEIVRRCADGDSTSFVRRSGTSPYSELIIEITERRSDGRRFQHRLVLERQSSPAMAQNK